MKPTVTDRTQISFLLPDLKSQINPRHPLCRLARAMDWGVFKKEFGVLYCMGASGIADPAHGGAFDAQEHE
ncbi:MAG: hypothetical protein KGR46_11565 [Verrucomicrobia bacterium]|nr:hypothetical protein [Verrucomicrobiota bacterium]